MLGWRKRNDGFEWRDYVRTTILVRRKHRRDRVGEARKAAVENLKAAGQRGAVVGAEGAKAVGRGAVHAGQQGAMMGVAGAKAMGRGAVYYGQRGAKMSFVGAKAAGSRLRAGIPVAGSFLQRLGAMLIGAIAYTWAVLRTIGGIAADYAGADLARRSVARCVSRASACRCSSPVPWRCWAGSSAHSPMASSATH